MKKQLFFASCPCCGEKLVVDLKQRRVDARDRTKQRKSSALEQPDDVLDAEQRKRHSSFERALDEETQHDKPSLDDLL